MEFIVKLIGSILGPALQLLGLLGVIIPSQTQEQILSPLVSNLASPCVFIPCVVVGTIATTIFYGSLWAEHKLKTAGGITKREFPPNLGRWDKVKNFTVWQASWLWGDLEPQAGNTNTEGTNAYPIFRKLKEDLKNGLVKGATKINGSWRETTLSRQQFIDYSFVVGEKPRFLFFDQRGWVVRRKIRTLFRRDVPNKEALEWRTLNSIQIGYYSYFTDLGQQVSITDINEIILNSLKSGERKAIGRKEVNGLLFHYERIPKRLWKKLKIESLEAVAGEVIYRDIRLNNLEKITSQPNKYYAVIFIIVNFPKWLLDRLKNLNIYP